MPLNDPLNSPLGGYPQPEPAEDNFYGHDILHERKLAVTDAGDYKLVRGIENYRRAIIRRLMTNPGEYKTRPGYGAGLRSLVKKPFTSTLRDEIRQRVIEQCLADRRTEKVIDCIVEVTTVNNAKHVRVTTRVQALGRPQQIGPVLIPRS